MNESFAGHHQLIRDRSDDIPAELSRQSNTQHQCRDNWCGSV